MSETNDTGKKPAKVALREVVDMVYQNAWDAKKRGEPVGWSSSKFPAELCETLGLAVCYPENQTAAISAKHAAGRGCANLRNPWGMQMISAAMPGSAWLSRQERHVRKSPCLSRISCFAAITSATA